MKKYRCPKCGETYEGELEKCPKCQTTMHYRKKIEEKSEDEAKIVERFNFDDPDVVKHPDKVPETILIEDEMDDEEFKKASKQQYSDGIVPNGESFFDGTFFGLLGMIILVGLITTFSLGIAVPWAVCLFYSWEAKHTYVQGHRLKFDGKGSQLIGRWLLWMLLTILTVGIFSLWIPIFFKKWKARHIMFAD